MAGIGSSRRRESINVWPGWVDALSSLVMVFLFVLMIFVVAQFYMSTTLSGREQALTRLNRQVAELSEMLALERQASADLRAGIARLSSQLQSSVGQREGMDRQLATVLAEREELAAQLSQVVNRGRQAQAEAEKTARDLEDAFKVISADREKIRLQLAEIASLQDDLRALRAAREKLEAEVAALNLVRQQTETALTQATGERERLSRELERAQEDAGRQAAEQTEALRLSEEQRRTLLEQIETLRDRSMRLESEVASAEERTQLAQREIQARDIRIEELVATIGTVRTQLSEEQATSAEGQRQVELLNQQVAALRQQLAEISKLLAEAEQRDADKQVQITNLGTQLNQALASRVQELARYRSEFFGRLREVVGDREDIRIVGDRFVFQSEVLFESGSATLEDRGRQRVGEIAGVLKELAAKIPPNVNWVLRVDGHTDRRPIATPLFRSNWELSMARAISVVRFLMEQGIPPERLAAAGFAEYQPLGPGDDPAALARNRRIEIKFDQR
ncbi:MAG TPA: peptidoglycan -binding protein [Azospirillaceae bacterium]|nr:peptidoglycan -binding protein [Azospirillaceae bacterium]